MEPQQKIWGCTRELVYTPFYAKHELDTIAGGYCSLHYHVHRANRFHVGTAKIEVVLMYGPQIQRVVLGPDNVFDVPSLVPHYFCIYEPGTVIEEYYPDRGGKVTRNDIVRLYEGGLLSIDELDQLPKIMFDEIRRQSY